jgi:multidrug efflux system membrane fusion protein
MLAIVEVSERKLGGVKLGGAANIKLVDGQVANGRVRYVSKSASATTRTYRVEVAIDNADGAIPDGITCEVKLALAPVQAVRVPRSSLTFSTAGELGVRTVNAQDVVEFVPVQVLADGQMQMWVDGIASGSRVIVQGQDFVREGQRVEPVPYQAASASAG